MEALAKRLIEFFLQRHYIESDQAEWLQYGLTRRMMGTAYLCSAASGWSCFRWMAGVFPLCAHVPFPPHADGRLSRENAAWLFIVISWYDGLIADACKVYFISHA